MRVLIVLVVLAGVAAGIQTLNMFARLGIPIERWLGPARVVAIDAPSCQPGASPGPAERGCSSPRPVKTACSSSA